MRTPRPWALPRQPATREQLLSPAVTQAMLRTGVRTGQLLRLRPGVYLAAECWPEDPAVQHKLLARAELATHPGAVLSHASAALVWGLPSVGREWHDALPTITLPRPSGYCAEQHLACYHTARVPPHHVTTDPEGYQVTTIARTAVDLARGRDLPSALVLFDAAARLLCAAVVVRPRREDYANPRLAQSAHGALLEAVARPGAAALRSAIALVDPRRESPIESLSAAHLHLAGLPVPDFQRPLRTSKGVYFADLYWEQGRLIGEADGISKYHDAFEIGREKEREQELRDTGYRIVRWLGREIAGTPEVVIARIARELGL